MENSSGEESNERGVENQSLLAMKERGKSNFLTLMAIT